MAKFIFVTGGVCSGLGKGITAASLGRLLKNRGLKVTAQKLDPYMNVDPGTMSPLQHGEVFVTDDGAETDLDLGHYERFIDESLNKYSNLTSGKCLYNVLNKERRGEYLGSTVQTIPHVTNEIKRFIYSAQEKSKADIIITEVGGTTGDIESQPFLEAIRQIGHEVGHGNALFIHVTLIPYLKSSGEHKSKPTQHSVKGLMSSGIFPDIIVTRSDRKIEQSIRDKIALFCNVDPECVIENRNVKILYEAPIMLHKEHLDDIVCQRLHLDTPECDLTKWQAMITRAQNAKGATTIALVGKYTLLHDAYLSVMEALKHAGWENNTTVTIKWIDSEQVTEDNVQEILKDVDGVLVPGGFGERGIEGMIISCSYARTHRIPYLGICLGMQVATISYARDVIGWKDANSSEFDKNSTHPVIALMNEQKNVVDLGGSMRLGAYPCKPKKGTLLASLYNDTDLFEERHRHRYEFNNNFREEMEKSGMTVCGTSPDNTLVEAIEIEDHPFFLGVQYHPEFKSRPNTPNPCFYGFVKAATDLENTK